MECFGTTDFDNNSRLITISAIIISGLYRIMYVNMVSDFDLKKKNPQNGEQVNAFCLGLN
jgi:hypothetical protein